MEIAILILGAYILGSVPTAVWYGKKFYKIDVREHGSGNAGATNTLRVLGNKAGFIVLFIDLLKGFIATNLVVFSSFLADSNNYFYLQMSLGITAVLGHVFPVFANFKGGKGIATLLGLAIALNYQIAIACILCFVAVVYITRFISVGSMLAASLAAVLSFYFYHSNVLANIFFVGIAIMVIFTHRANIKRLLAGNENKFSFNKKTQ
jgi:glycerol-3-phosphate acyltransferase PlsY